MERLGSHSIDSLLMAVEDTSADHLPARRVAPVETISNRWRELGLRPGEIVLICLPNSIELLSHLFGVLQAGGVPALVSPSMPPARLREIVDALEARAVVVPRMQTGRVYGGELFTIATAGAVLFKPREDLSTEAGEIIILTSGTSGSASGCLFSLDALLLNADRHADAIGLTPNDATLVNLPLHYSYALVAQVFASLIRGAHLIISGPPFHVPSYFDLVTERRVTVSSLTPVLVRHILQNGQKPPNNLRIMTVGGDSLGPQQVEGLLRLRPEGELYLTYGLTEAGPRVSTLAAHREPRHRFASVGLPLPETKVFLDNSKTSSGPRELLISSRTLMKRRIGRVEGRSRTDWHAPGVLASGDLFDIDEDGYLYFHARTSDFLIKNGEKVCLASIRRIAISLPGVIGTKIHVLKEAEGKAEYDLTLMVRATSENSWNDLQTQLLKSMLRSERPRRINFVAVEEEATLSFK